MAVAMVESMGIRLLPDQRRWRYSGCRFDTGGLSDDGQRTEGSIRWPGVSGVVGVVGVSSRSGVDSVAGAKRAVEVSDEGEFHNG